MSKIKKILTLADLPLRLLGQFDDQLNDLFCHFEGDLDDLESYLTEKRFTIASVGKDNFYSKDKFFILDCDEYALADFELTDPKNLLDSDCPSFTIKEYQKLFYANSSLIDSIRRRVSDLLFSEVPADLYVFGEVAFNG